MIELNGIQISDNNINTRKNVKIYIDEKYIASGRFCYTRTVASQTFYEVA